MEKIILTKMVKTKTDKIMLEFIKPVSEKSQNSKGFNSNTLWLDDIELYNKLEQNDFGKVIEANLGYSEPDYEGKCKIIIKDFMINGKIIKL